MARAVCLTVFAAPAVMGQSADSVVKLVNQVENATTATRLSETTSKWPAGTAKRNDLPEATWDYEFSDVAIQDIANWIEWFGIELPVALDGEVSGWLWARRAEGNWLRLSDYRVEGEISSAALSIDNWQVAPARLRFGYSAGTWYIGDLSGSVNMGEQPVGELKVASRLPVDSKAQIDLLVSGELTRLQTLFSAFEIPVEVTHEPGQVDISAQAPMNRIYDFGVWSADGAFEMSEVRASSLPAAELDGRLTLDEGKWEIRPAVVTMAGQTVLLEATGSLGEVPDFEANLEANSLSLGRLANALAESNPSLAVGKQKLMGAINVRASIAGDAKEGLTGLNASVTSDEIVALDQPWRQIDLSAKMEADKLIVRLRNVNLATGNAVAMAVWPSDRVTDLGLPDTLAADLNAISLKTIIEFTGTEAPNEVDGVINGQVRFSHASGVEDVPELDQRWASEIRLKLSRLSGISSSVRDLYFSGSKQLNDEFLSFKLYDTARQVDASGEIVFAERNTPQVALNRIPADETDTTDSALRLEIEGVSVRGTVRELRWSLPIGGESQSFTASGDFSARTSGLSDIEVVEASLASLRTRFGDRPIELDDVELKVLPSQFRLEQFRLTDGVGTALGSAVWHRSAGQESHAINLKLDDWAIADYWDEAQRRRLIPVLPGKSVTGLISLSLQLEKSVESQSALWVGWTGNANGHLEQVTVSGVPAADLSFVANSTYAESTHSDSPENGANATSEPQPTVWKVSANGELLGAVLNATVENLSLVDNVESAERPTNVRFDTVRLSLEHLELDRVTGVLGDRADIRNYRGQADILLQGVGPDIQSGSWLVEATVPRLIYQGRVLADSLRAQLRAQNDQFEVSDLRGRVAGGQVRSSGRLTWKAGMSTPRGRLVVDASKLDVNRVVTFFLPEMKDQFEGSLSTRGAIDLQRAISMHAPLRLTDSVVFGVPIQEAHGNVRAELDSDLMPRKLVSHDLAGTVLGGRARADVRMDFGAGLELASNWSVVDAHMDQLSRALGFEHIVGSGRFDMSANLKSNRLNSIADLYGPLNFDFNGGNAQSFPLLSDLGDLAPILHLTSTKIKSGQMQAQMGAGQLRIQSLILDSDAFWLVADGSAGLTSGRLDLQGLLQTGGGVQQQAVQEGAEKLIAYAIPPAVALTAINDLVANRTIYFNVGGTSSHPVIQPRAAQTLANALLDNVRRRLLTGTSSVIVGD